MLVFGEFGIMLGCTLGSVHGDCDGDRIRLHVLGTSGESCGGRDATRLGVPMVMEVQIWVQL